MKKGLILDRPRDKSLQAFKEYMKSVTGDLIGETGEDEMDDMTEAEWKEDWERYWKSEASAGDSDTKSS